MSTQEENLNAERELRNLLQHVDSQERLLYLAPFLPIDMLLSILNDARKIKDPASRFLVMATLVDRGKNIFSVVGLVSEAREAASAIGDPLLRIQALFALAEVAPLEMQNSIFYDVGKVYVNEYSGPYSQKLFNYIPYEVGRNFLVREIVPELFSSRVSDAIDYVYEVDEDRGKGVVLSGVASMLDSSTQSEWLNATRQIAMPQEQSQVLISALPKIQDTRFQVDLSKEVLHVTPTISPWNTQAARFGQLNRVMPKRVVATALEHERKIESFGVRTRALASLAPRLGIKQLYTLVDVAKDVPQEIQGRGILLSAINRRARAIGEPESQSLIREIDTTLSKMSTVTTNRKASSFQEHNVIKPSGAYSPNTAIGSLWEEINPSSSSVSELLDNLDPRTAEVLSAALISEKSAPPTERFIVQARDSSRANAVVKIHGGTVSFGDYGGSIIQTGDNNELLTSSDKNITEATSSEENILSFQAIRPQHFVSTGFSQSCNPSLSCPADHPLQTDEAYLFWLEVGAPVPGAIDEVPTELPLELLPPDAELDVVLLSNNPEIIVESPSRGSLLVKPDGTVQVKNHAYRPDSSSLEEPYLLDRRLFFQVTTPQDEGEYRLRCSIFFRNVLVQSREVTIYVANSAARKARSLVTQLDYTLSRSLSPGSLREGDPHKLSITINRADDGTHNFHFVGEGEYQSTANFDTAEVQDLIESLRRKLRLVSWGSEEPWQAGNKDFKYRYEREQKFSGLLRDLYEMAREGYSQYDVIAGKLGGGSALEDLMKDPGLIQLAIRESVRLVLPLSLIYDHPLDDGLSFEEYSLCDHFKRCVGEDIPLDEQDCFTGNCPNHGDDSVICPGGFWGFRHEIGIPVTLVPENDWPPEVPNEIEPADVLELAVAVCTDEQLKRRDHHIEALRKLLPEEVFHYAESRNEAFTLMKDVNAQVFYFYCHGGVDGNKPFIQLGPMNGHKMFRSNLRSKKIKWDKPHPRPLVFINGCHTVNVEPEVAIDMVSGFFNVAGASAVLGTEITVFEPLAVNFSERFLKSFLIDRHSLGKAVKRTRLAILKEQLNPLGLAYLPFGLASLHLADINQGIIPQNAASLDTGDGLISW